MMKQLMLSFLLIGLYSFGLGQATDRFWWHEDGVKAQWYEQSDVIIFKTAYNEAFLAPGIPGVSLVIQGPDWHGLHQAYLYPGADSFDVATAKALFEGHPGFECYYQAITKDSTAPAQDKKWRVVDDLLQVVFESPIVLPVTLDSFMSRWDLEIVYAPDSTFQSFFSWPYLFRNVHPQRCSSRWSIDIARDIMEQDSALVEYAEPNIINLFESASWDPNYDDGWHLHNTGQMLHSTYTGSLDADCNIKEAWERGFTGDGVPIAVIDKGGFSPNHPDMVGAYAHTFSSKDTFPITDHMANWNWFDPHGEASAGLIAARKDNQIGGAGVAPRSKIGAYVFDGSPAQAMRCLLDIYREPNGTPYPIVSLGWSSYLPSTEGMQCFRIVLDELIQRGNRGNGTLVFAAAGNRGNQDLHFPAAFPGVVAVSATTPDDKIKILGDPFMPFLPKADWASNFGSHIDFGAPGACLGTHDLHGSSINNVNLGEGTGDYLVFHGTSGATAIAAGIAALVMEADPSLPPLGPQSVYSTLAQSAETVGGYDYNYDPLQPGRSKETGHGRLNAHTAVNLVSLPDPSDPSLATFQLATHSNGENRIYYDISRINGPVQLVVTNLQGQTLSRIALSKGTPWMTLDKQSFSAGLYFLHLDQDGEVISRVKKWLAR